MISRLKEQDLRSADSAYNGLDQKIQPLSQAAMRIRAAALEPNPIDRAFLIIPICSLPVELIVVGPAKDLGNQTLESWMAAQRIKQRLDFDVDDIGIMSRYACSRSNRLFVVTYRRMCQGKGEKPYVSMRAQLLELREEDSALCRVGQFSHILVPASFP